MDASWGLWVFAGLAVIVIIAAIVLMARRGASSASADVDETQPETPGDGYARPRPGLPGEPER